jgi:hypothetical protein
MTDEYLDLRTCAAMYVSPSQAAVRSSTVSWVLLRIRDTSRGAQEGR